jgi:anti-anti-sigma factor
MKIKSQNENGIWIINLKGRLDAPWVGAFKRAIAPHLEEGTPHFIFDLRELDYIDSTGLAALLSILRRSESKGGTMRLQNLNSEVESLFLATRLNKLLSIENTGIDEPKADVDDHSASARPLWLS